MEVPFNRVHLTGKEIVYLQEVLASGWLSGNGRFSKECAHFFEQRYDITKALLTTSCTDALEMCAILLGIGPGDEVILPSYTFVSTANSFLLRGARLVFADSSPSHPNLDLDHVERLITPSTRVIVVVHYGGVACDMDRLYRLIGGRDIKIVEDAAHSIGAFYKGKPLGTLGALSAFSFHQTKNIISGEGGLLAINDPVYAQRAEILWEKGTNRSQFFRGEVDKYGWMDVGSSFLASDLIAAVLWAQLERLEEIQDARISIWDRYENVFRPLAQRGLVEIPLLPEYATNNAHMYTLICASLNEREALISHLRRRGVHATFHYQPLHSSPFFAARYAGEELVQAARFADCLTRLPIIGHMSDQEVDAVIVAVKEFYDVRS